MNIVNATKAANMPIAVQLVACFSALDHVEAKANRGEAKRRPGMPVRNRVRGHFSASRLTFSDSSSNSLLARRT